MKREAVTIKFPADLVQKAKQLKTDSDSFNELVVEALEKEVKRRRASKAHETILEIREQVKKRTGIHPDPVFLIRQLREGEER